MTIQVFGFGGSHGGFLIAHLAGQRPSMLAGAVIRNAAFDIVPKVGVSDIPDWNFVEALGQKDFLWSQNLCLTPEEIDGMCDASPVKVVDCSRLIKELFWIILLRTTMRLLRIISSVFGRDENSYPFPDRRL